MHPNIQAKIEELHAALKEHTPNTTVGFKLFINSQECEVTWRTRTPEQLRQDGITMRNIRGDWIK
jgi:hypothetical protein